MMVNELIAAVLTVLQFSLVGAQLRPPAVCNPAATDLPLLNGILADVEITIDLSDAGDPDSNETAIAIGNATLSHLCLGTLGTESVAAPDGMESTEYFIGGLNMFISVGFSGDLGGFSVEGDAGIYIENLGFNATIVALPSSAILPTNVSLESCNSSITNPGTVDVDADIPGPLSGIVEPLAIAAIAAIIDEALDGSILCSLVENITDNLNARPPPEDSSGGGNDGMSQGVVLGLAATGLGVVAAAGLGVAYSSKKKRQYDTVEGNDREGAEHGDRDSDSKLSEPLFGATSSPDYGSA